ncbi:MAG: hypothetical protein ABS939_00045 [Psychrobacillus sp.]
MKIHPTCSLCVHFEPNTSQCTLMKIGVIGMEQEKPKECLKTGAYLRNMNVLLDSYHLYGEDEMVPYAYKEDVSKLPVDDKGIPLFVFTKRGRERVIPVNSEIPLKGDALLGVHKALTYQGQRELIYDLGVDLASEVAKSRGIELVVLPGEESSKGIESEIARYQAYAHVKTSSPAALWKSEEGGW